MTRLKAALMLGMMGLAGCGAPDDAGEMAMADVVYGPVDGHDLPAIDLDRVQTGQMAPDFTLASLAGPPVTLSGFRGEKNVVLVFYRGHW